MDFKEIFGSNKPRCQHFLEDGSRCKADPQTGKKFCFMHDPEQKQKQAEARKQGGQARYPTPQVILPSGFTLGPLDDLAEVRKLIREIMAFVFSGEMDQRTGGRLCYMANSIASILKAEAHQQREAARKAEREAERKAKEPMIFQKGPDGYVIYGPKQDFRE